MSNLSSDQKSINKPQYVLYTVCILFVCLFVWALISYTGWVDPVFIPTPTAVLFAVINLYRNFNLIGDIWISVVRIFLGFTLASVIAVPMGIYLALSKRAQAILEPAISFIRYLPPSALLPLFLLWFGIGETSKVLLICFGVLPYIALMTYDVVAQTKAELVDVARTLGASSFAIKLRVIIPVSLPGIWDTLRINIGAAWTFLILAEIVASTTGLGHLIITSQRFIKTPNVIGAIIIIGLLGYATDLFFKITYKLWFPWTEKSYAGT